MEDQLAFVKSLLRKLQGTLDKAILQKYNLNKCERVAEKLNNFSPNCMECQQQLSELKDHLIQLESKKDRLEYTDYNHHNQLIKGITSHLHKKHKLLPEGYYLSIYMSFGISIGCALGLTIFNNIALGIPIGMGIGIAIGAGLDADAKKKGKTI
ncbi:hypothetical protein [Neobacillus dielmonensis]|uniref:hypothetical protein n=1 Tax=Neobacillus dielmonensis TaxID=1347369 RepID=UPI0005A875AF|nr:hypothetical protein [Neobacillus dielmonensis]